MYASLLVIMKLSIDFAAFTTYDTVDISSPCLYMCAYSNDGLIVINTGVRRVPCNVQLDLQCYPHCPRASPIALSFA